MRIPESLPHILSFLILLYTLQTLTVFSLSNSISFHILQNLSSFPTKIISICLFYCPEKLPDSEVKFPRLFSVQLLLFWRRVALSLSPQLPHFCPKRVEGAEKGHIFLAPYMKGCREIPKSFATYYSLYFPSVSLNHSCINNYLGSFKQYKLFKDA